MRQISVVIDLPVDAKSYLATIEALEHAVAAADSDLDIVVVRTPEIDQHFLDTLDGAVVIGPGSPYDCPDNAEGVIRSCRERGVPLVGT